MTLIVKTQTGNNYLIESLQNYSSTNSSKKILYYHCYYYYYYYFKYYLFIYLFTGYLFSVSKDDSNKVLSVTSQNQVTLHIKI